MAEKTNYMELEAVELNKLRVELKQKLRAMRFEQVIGSSFNLGEFRKAKQDIARINTVLTLKARKEGN